MSQCTVQSNLPRTATSTTITTDGQRYAQRGRLRRLDVLADLADLCRVDVPMIPVIGRLRSPLDSHVHCQVHLSQAPYVSADLTKAGLQDPEKENNK